MEGRRRAAHRQQDREPERDHEPSVPVGKFAKAVQEKCHVRPFCGVVGGVFSGRFLRRRTRCGSCETGSEQAHRIDEQLAQDRQRPGGEVWSAAAEPHVHRSFAAGDDRACEGTDVELVCFSPGARVSPGAAAPAPPAATLWGTLAGSSNNLLGAVVPGLELGACHEWVALGQAEQLGERRHGHGICQFHEGGACGLEDGFVRGTPAKLLERVVQEAVGHRRNGGLCAAEVVEEGPA